MIIPFIKYQKEEARIGTELGCHETQSWPYANCSCLSTDCAYMRSLVATLSISLSLEL